MEKKYQIFISSTFEDLKEQRQAAIKAVLDMGQIPAGMEYFPSNGEDQYSYIKRVIDLSDFYVLIIGYKYGSLCSDGKSYTEKEYDYAISTGKKVLAFIRVGFNENVLSDTPLGKFVAKINSGLRREWNNDLDLQSQLKSSLSQIMQDNNTPEGWVRGSNALEEIEKAKLEDKSDLSQYKIDKMDVSSWVLDLLIQNNTLYINKFFSDTLPIIKHAINRIVKTAIFDYLFNQWEQNPTWDGTARVMPWINKYFELIQPDNYSYLMHILQELTSSTYSYKAWTDTLAVANKLRPEMFIKNSNEFLDFCSNLVIRNEDRKVIPLKLFQQLFKTNPFCFENQEQAQLTLILAEKGISPDTKQEFEKLEKLLFYR